MALSHYVQEILKKFGMEKYKSLPTPMETKSYLQTHIEGDTKLSDTAYRQLVGSVMYLVLCTRPDISFSTGALSKFLSDLTDAHWTSAIRLLRFLQGTIDMKLLFSRSAGFDIVAYCDADWASSYDRKSTTGYLIYIGNNLVMWKSKKQSTIALSSTEAEFIAATETIREIIWVRNFTDSFRIEINRPNLYCDTQPAIAIANSTGYHGRSKHMDVKYKFLSQCLSADSIHLVYVSTSDNIAGTLTKSLPRSSIEKFVNDMNLSCLRWVGGGYWDVHLEALDIFSITYYYRVILH